MFILKIIPISWTLPDGNRKEVFGVEPFKKTAIRGDLTASLQGRSLILAVFRGLRTTAIARRPFGSELRLSGEVNANSFQNFVPQY